MSNAAEHNGTRVGALRPLLRAALAILWIGSGLAALLQRPWLLQHAFERVGLGTTGTKVALGVVALAQIAIGAALLMRWRPRHMMLIQLGLVGAYMLALTVLLPSLWLKPFGPLLTGIPVLVAILMLEAVERAR